MEPFPPNSHKTRQPQDKNIKPVVKGETIRRKRPMGSRFTQTFFSGDARTALGYAIQSVLVPAAKEAIVEAGSSMIEKLIYGDSRPRRGASNPPLGHVAYNRMSNQKPKAEILSTRARATHNFDEIVISSRAEAEEVIDRMYDLLSKYEMVTIADLYVLTDQESSHVDHTWGWMELRGAGVSRVRRGNGYVLDLPEPEHLGRVR